VGALAAAVATGIFLVTKFTAGAWVEVGAVPIFIVLFRRIHRHYERVAAILAFGQFPPVPERKGLVIVVPVTNLSRLTAHAPSEALSLGGDVVAATVVTNNDDARRAEDLLRRSDRWNPGGPLVSLRARYASVVDPIWSGAH
jgi:hypothetical protein